MKFFMIGLLAMVSISAYAQKPEISETKCELSFVAETGKISLSNSITNRYIVIEGNCLDLVKEVSETLIEDKKVNGVTLDYTNI